MNENIHLGAFISTSLISDIIDIYIVKGLCLYIDGCEYYKSITKTNCNTFIFQQINEVITGKHFCHTVNIQQKCICICPVCDDEQIGNTFLLLCNCNEEQINEINTYLRKCK